MYSKPPMIGPQTQPPPSTALGGVGSLIQPKAGPGMMIQDPARPTSPLPPSVDPMRQRLAEAIMKATTPSGGQDVQHPMQALGNAANQMSSAYLKNKLQPQGPARTSPAPGPGPVIQPSGGPGAAYYSGAKKPPLPPPPPLPGPGGPRPMRPLPRPQQRPQRRPPFPGA